jgi:GNAT superfamily N-acetyltransferase
MSEEITSSDELSHEELLESLNDIDEVRLLCYSDYEKGYLQLISASQPMTYSEFILGITRIHQNPFHTIWVIEDIHVHKIIACATLVFEPKLGEKMKARVEDFFIHPEYLSYGFDVKLMKFLRQKVREEGCSDLSLCCPREGFRFYRRHGFFFSRMEMASPVL